MNNNRDPYEILIERMEATEQPWAATATLEGESDWLAVLLSRHPERVKWFERLHKAPRFCKMVISRRLREIDCDFVTVDDLRFIIDSNEHSIVGIEVVGKDAVAMFEGYNMPTRFAQESKSIFDEMVIFLKTAEKIVGLEHCSN